VSDESLTEATPEIDTLRLRFPGFFFSHLGNPEPSRIAGC